MGALYSTHVAFALSTVRIANALLDLCPVHKPNGIPSESTSYNGPMPHFPYLPTSEGSESRASCFSSIGKGEGGVGRIAERRSADRRVRSPTSWNRWSNPSRKPAQAQTPQTRRDQYIYISALPPGCVAFSSSPSTITPRGVPVRHALPPLELYLTRWREHQFRVGRGRALRQWFSGGSAEGLIPMVWARCGIIRVSVG